MFFSRVRFFFTCSYFFSLRLFVSSTILNREKQMNGVHFSSSEHILSHKRFLNRVSFFVSRTFNEWSTRFFRFYFILIVDFLISNGTTLE